MLRLQTLQLDLTEITLTGIASIENLEGVRAL